MEWMNARKEIPLLAEVDVAVAGGGTAGSVAAIAAAREGARTLVVERYGTLGGSASMGQVVPLMQAGLPGDPDASSISLDIKRLMMEKGWAAMGDDGNDGWFNPVMIGFTLDSMLKEAGGKALFDTTVIDAGRDGNTLKELLVQTRAGLGRIRAGCFIDATGDALVSSLAGVPCMEGRERGGRNQSVSLRFTLGGIDMASFHIFLLQIGQTWNTQLPLLETSSLWDRAEQFPMEKVFRKGLEQGLITYEDGRYFQAFAVPGMPGCMAFNCPEIPDMHQAMSPFATSEAYVTGREMTLRIHHFLHLMVPGFENSYVQSSGPMLGVRESRRIRGEYVLTLEDYMMCRKWADGIAQTAYPIDIHGGEAEEKAVKAGEVDLDPNRMIPDGEWFEVPFRCMVPLEVDRLVVAGRCISASFAAQSAIRIQPTCRATGEAAGLAAAWLALGREGCTDLRSFDGSRIRDVMKERGGVFLDRQ